MKDFDCGETEQAFPILGAGGIRGDHAGLLPLQATTSIYSHEERISLICVSAGFEHHRRTRVHFIGITMSVSPAKRMALSIARSPCELSLATSSA
jgi:hypothetical protein